VAWDSCGATVRLSHFASDQECGRRDALFGVPISKHFSDDEELELVKQASLHDLMGTDALENPSPSSVRAVSHSRQARGDHLRKASTLSQMAAVGKLCLGTCQDAWVRGKEAGRAFFSCQDVSQGGLRHGSLEVKERGLPESGHAAVVVDEGQFGGDAKARGSGNEGAMGRFVGDNSCAGSQGKINGWTDPDKETRSVVADCADTVIVED
jgi:hypothetical protein